MIQTSGNCKYCGDEFHFFGVTGELTECYRCQQIRMLVGELSLQEIARLLDAAAELPEGTHLIKRRALVPA